MRVISLEFAGKTRSLKITNRALFEIEEKIGMAIMTLFNSDMAKNANLLLSRKLTAATLWGGFLHDPEIILSFDEVIDNLPTEADKYSEIVKKVSLALMDALGMEEISEEDLEKMIPEQGEEKGPEEN